MEAKNQRKREARGVEDAEKDDDGEIQIGGADSDGEDEGGETYGEVAEDGSQGNDDGDHDEE